MSTDLKLDFAHTSRVGPRVEKPCKECDRDFSASGCGDEVERPFDAIHGWRRTRAMAWATVGAGLGRTVRPSGGLPVGVMQQVGRLCDPGEEPHHDRCGAGDGPVGPLTLGFHSQTHPPDGRSLLVASATQTNPVSAQGLPPGRCLAAPRSLAGKPLAGFHATRSRRIQV